MVCGSLEIEILNSFWNLTAIDEDRDISIQDVVDDLSSNGTQRAYTTIKTVMDRLVTKSILVRYKVGKKFFYKEVTMRKSIDFHQCMDEYKNDNNKKKNYLKSPKKEVQSTGIYRLYVDISTDEGKK